MRPANADTDFVEAARRTLRRTLGPDADFRSQQLQSIETIVKRRERLLVIQRTGWGKSAVYFVATKLLRDQGAGPSIIISPLLALMRDQIEAAARFGLRASSINSSNRSDWARVEAELLDGSVDVLLISPERLNNAEFRDELFGPLAKAAGLLVVDEAHCISDWGHDFRPDYRRITRVLELMPSNVPVLCTTATANRRVTDDVVRQLGADLAIIRGPLDRESLTLQARRLTSQAERLAWLAEWIPKVHGSGIVYCLTVADVIRVAEWLNENGITALAYHGESEQRLKIEQDLKDNVVKVVASTSALGMGFDKPDLAFVVHFQSPDSPVGYYQQVGRAGRAVERATAVLLYGGAEDDGIWSYFLKNSLPTQRQAEKVVRLLEASADWMSLHEIEAHVNAKKSRLGGLLKILEVEGAIERDGSRYRRTLRPWTFDDERVGRVREARLREQQLMRAYATTSRCRMAFLRGTLDDDAISECGRCDNCRGLRPSLEVPRRQIVRAEAFIRRRPVEIEPRWYWPSGYGAIDVGLRLQIGRALADVSDPGWGHELLKTKDNGTHVSAAMVDASAELVRSWLGDTRPTIVYVPSIDPARTLVGDFAQRLADALAVPISHCLRKTRQTQRQKLMENTAQQYANVKGAYAVEGAAPSGAVLLVDDVSDSRWTMTVIGAQLAEAGTGPIYPFAIAKMKG